MPSRRLLPLLVLLLPLLLLAPLWLALRGRTSAAEEAAEDAGRPAEGSPSPAVLREPFPGERRLKNLRQLTFRGENAEAYWSHDGRRLVFQSTREDLEADQIFVMDADGRNARMVSTGKGRTTCAYFLPGDRRILYASTHLAGDAPPERPRHRGYFWPAFASYDIFTASAADGSDLRPLVRSPGYDAEATVSPRGDRIVFTSARDGDLDLYAMDLDGANVVRLTDAPGFDGGAFHSWDGKRIVWRAPAPGNVDAEAFRELLAREIVLPGNLEIWVMDADGSNKRMVTNNGAANFAPSWHPDDRRVIFSSNLHDPSGHGFDLYLVDTETGEVERVTHFERKREGGRHDDFDGFPHFSPDGKHLAFCSNRHNESPNDTNVFVCEWVD